MVPLEKQKSFMFYLPFTISPAVSIDRSKRNVDTLAQAEFQEEFTSFQVACVLKLR